MDFLMGFPQTFRGVDTTCIMVNRPTKLAHFVPVWFSYSDEQLARAYVQEIVYLHRVLIFIISN